jgi:NAD(P)H-dependent flavin oxidoreductase YrpB (nitropropane dioxygenase family)
LCCVWLGPLSAEETRKSIREIRSMTDKPFGIGATLLMPGAKENAEVALQEKVPVINFSLGKGDWIVERAHAYGGKVIATVVNEKHAKSAESMGVDALMVSAIKRGLSVTLLTNTLPFIGDWTRGSSSWRRCHILSVGSVSGF